ncbi:MAG: sulfotransferase domain-containing protein, partial [Deltaproteobacteria bacterium]|nr:sulfotransferase domain-containing protein [Deltaproteobacteria bacterium]
MKNPFHYIKRIPSRFFIDIYTGKDDSTVFISGMGRSGTTWLSELINYNNSYRDIFEPFHPHKVKETKIFKYNQYLNPKDQNPKLLNQANKILSGRFQSKWTDRNNKKIVATERIIKDIRTNLMLKWLKGIRPDMPIILIVRHP